MPKLRVMLLLAVGVVAFSGVVVSSAPVEAQQRSLEAEFRSAEREYGVPAELLMAMGYVNTRWETPAERSRDGGWGVMHLVDNSSTDTLSEASRLTGIPKAQLRTNRSQNIMGAAALLARAQGSSRSANLNSWYDAVAEMGGSAIYANQVYDTLQSGASETISTGERVRLAPQSGASPRRLFTPQGSADYLKAEWYPANDKNFTAANRPDSPKIDSIVIHVTQASYANALDWFQDPKAQTSSHYVVRSSDGQIAQSVSDMNIAWHAGNYSYNRTSIGIEHEGYVGNAKWFTNDMYRSSAKLAAYMCDKYGIPIDRQHIFGHNEVPKADHTDPGPHWDWGTYMRLIRRYADGSVGGGSGGSGGGSSDGSSDSSGGARNYSQIIDNADETTSGRFSAGGPWNYSEVNSERYYWNYRYSRPKATSNTANYKFDIPARDRYAVYGWWPSKRKYNSATPIGVKTAGGWKWISVNQSRSGGRWVPLGTYRMTPEDEWKVKISRWAGGRGYVIADAIKVVRR